MGLTAGTRLGPYEIVSPIGAGGMGEVYRARDTRLGRDVAVKVLPDAFAQDADPRARFEREAQVVAALSHPNIVNLFDTGSDHGRVFVVMELLHGETLRERLANGVIPPRKAVEYAVHIARGLGAAHDKGLVHRDLKPENVFLQDDGHVKILDFGLARQSTVSSHSGATQTVAGTDPGTVMGTVGYMAPEQIRGQAVDARTDLFALGAVLYEMLTGRRAFHRETAAETMTAILKEDPPDFGPERSDLSPALDRIVRHALEKNPAERFQSARDVAFAIASLSGSGSAGVPAVAAPSRRGLRAILTAVAAALLVAVGVMGGRLSSPRVEHPQSFTQKSFDNAFVINARFMPDSRTIVYTAGKYREPPVMYVLREASAPQPIGPKSAAVLSISKSGEIAVLTDIRFESNFIAPVGTLARMTLDTAPKPVLADVKTADWGPDGSLAIVRRVSGLDQLEFPIGKPLYTSPGYLSDVRVSPDGRRVLFVDHQTQGDDRGWVRIAEDTGTLTTVGGDFPSAVGASWSPDGKRIFFSVSGSGSQVELFAADAPAAGVHNPERTRILPAPVEIVIADVAADGSFLVIGASRRYMVGAKLRQDPGERDLTYLDISWIPSLSDDGALLFFTDGHGGANNSAVLRRTDGSPVARLGDGSSVAMSPDGKWAVAVVLADSPQKLVAYPTGPGDPVVMPRGPVEKYTDGGGFWSPDSRHLVFRAAEVGKGPQTFIQSIQGGPPRVVVPERVRVALFSRDGHGVLGHDAARGWKLYPIEGNGPTRDMPRLNGNDEPVGWSSDGRALIVATTTIPARLERVELSTGARRLLRELRPPGLEGIRVNVYSVTADGEQFAYDGLRATRTLYVVK